MIFKRRNNDPDNSLIKIAALLIHAAKIDQNYSSVEKGVIKKTIIKLGAINKNIVKIINDA